MGLDVRDIALDTLSISLLNVRRDLGDLTELMASITEVGVLEPIVVRPMGEGYEVIAGYRRTEAARRAGLQTIPASVLELTDIQAILTSLIEKIEKIEKIENIQRKALSLEERVVTYQQLQALEPEYRSQRALAKATDQSHRKIGEDFQAYEIALKLQPRGIRVGSDFPRTSPERQEGIVLPVYHAVLTHQAMSSLVSKGAVAEEDADEKMAELANLIVPLSQDAAKALIEQVKAGEHPARLTRQQGAGSRQGKSGWHGASRYKKTSPKRRENGGLVTCSCCDRVLQLVHRADGTHAVVDTPFSGQLQLPAPAFPQEPVAAARTPDTALPAAGMPAPILKRTAGYTITSFPKGLNSVLTLQTTGFWGKLSQSPANPAFTETDIPQSIWTFEPWLGCIFGTSCRFCYVPSVATRIYPNGRQSYWYQQWGNWLLYKPDITTRLRRQLLDGAGHTRPAYTGTAIYMSPKTDPLLPIKDALHITAQNLDVFLDAECFLMIQTRSKAVEENEPAIFDRIIELSRQKKVGVSFSISTDLLSQQRRIEFGGLSPDERFRIMARLKHAGVFVSAAVAPLMPYSPDFARRLVESCHHASIQVLHLTGSGAATPKHVLAQMHCEIPQYRELERKLAEEIDALDVAEDFSWGIANKGFIGAFLAGRKFYETVSRR